MAGKYTKFMCIENCNDGQMNWSNRTIYQYTAGKIYGCNLTPNFPTQKNGIYTEEINYDFGGSGNYMGAVNYTFLMKYFIPLGEYIANRKELDILFDTFMSL